MNSPSRPKTGPALGKLMPPNVERRLYLLIALALTLSVILLGWSYWQRYQAERDQILRTEQEVAEGVGQAFEAFIRDVHRTSLTLGYVLAAGKLDERANQLMVQAVQQYVSINSISWTSPTGVVQASSESEAAGTELGDRAYFNDLARGNHMAVSELLPTGRVSKRSAFVVATAVRNAEGKFLGAVVVSIDPARLGQLSLTQQRPAGSSYTLFDQKGALVFRQPDVDMSWDERTAWLQSDRLLKQALSGQTVAGETHSVVSGERFFAARVPLEFGWVAGAGRTTDSALAPIKKALARDMALSALLIAAMLALAVFIGRSITVPLQRLEDDVIAFGQGDKERRTQVTGPAEVAEVAVVFNRMADELTAYQASLEQQVRKRTAELEASNRELEAFSYTVAHDLRSPLRALDGFSRHLMRHHAGQLDEAGKGYLTRIYTAAQRMGRLIDDLLNMANVARRPLQPEEVELSALASDLLAALRRRDPSRKVEAHIQPGLTVYADRHLMQLALEQLLGNAWKFTADLEVAQIGLGIEHSNEENIYYLRDNGVGFDMKYAGKLFLPFHRLRADDQYAGTGMGLALVQRIIERHGGRIWAEGEPNQGATFRFTLGDMKHEIA